MNNNLIESSWSYKKLIKNLRNKNYEKVLHIGDAVALKERKESKKD